MKTPHKHADVIKAWADGAEIEVKLYSDVGWFPLKEPHWHLEREYRIKPKREPDVVRSWYAKPCGMSKDIFDNNLELTFDGETGKLKSARVFV